MSVLQPIYVALAKTITFWHDVLARIPGLTAASGVTWTLAIAMLVVTVRLLLFPVFVKQIRSQRAMQELQPRMKALQAKHKGDRETLNQEMMKLYKEAGVNPLAGCLPLLLQMPIFIALFQVLRQLGPSIRDGVLVFPDKFGVPTATAEEFGRAKLFGAPIAAGVNSPKELLELLNAAPLTVKLVCGFFIVAMSLTQFISTRQLMARSTTTPDAAQASQQKVLLYVMPIMFGVFGFTVPLGVLLYWTTTNLWTLGQQAYVIKHMPHTPGGMPIVDPKHGPGTKGAPTTKGGSTTKGGASAKGGSSTGAARTDRTTAGKPEGKSRFGRAAHPEPPGTANGTPAAVDDDAADEAAARAQAVGRLAPNRPPSAKARKKARARKGGRR